MTRDAVVEPQQSPPAVTSPAVPFLSHTQGWGCNAVFCPQIVDTFVVGRLVLLVFMALLLVGCVLLLGMHLLEPIHARPLRCWR